MKRHLLATLLVLGMAACALPTAEATDQTPIGHIAARRAAMRPWHGAHYHAAWGAPVALVVPPNAALQTDYRWGVPSRRISTIYHQYGRNYPGAMLPGGQGFMPTPVWPSDTNQFGVHYIRAPW